MGYVIISQNPAVATTKEKKTQYVFDMYFPSSTINSSPLGHLKLTQALRCFPSEAQALLLLGLPMVWGCWWWTLGGSALLCVVQGGKPVCKL